MGFQKILVGLDDSPLGQRVFAQGLDLAKAYCGQLHLLHVIQNPAQFMSSSTTLSGFSDIGAYPVFSDPSFWEAQAQSRKEQAGHWLEHYQVQAQQAGVVTGWSSQMGEAGPILCEMAQQHQADLIVVGRRGLSGLSEVFAGSVSNYVMHHAPCSVLVVQIGTELTLPAS